MKKPIYNYDGWFELGLSKELGVGEFFEKIIENIYTKILTHGDNVIDGGANKGRHTFPLSKIIGESGRVFAIEAIPSLAQKLEQNIFNLSLNNIKVIPEAIGNKIGTTKFAHITNSDGYSGRFERPDIPDTSKKSVQELILPMNTIDSILDTNKISALRFIKLDLEGGEFDALSGAEETLREKKPFVIFENGGNQSAKLYSYSIDNWFELFNRNQYFLFDLFGRPFNRDAWNQSKIPWYLIAVSKKIDQSFVKNELKQIIENLS